MTYHQTIIIGNLGADPELRYLPDGKPVCNFSAAVSESWTDRATNEKREITTWYHVAVWGPQAEHCNRYLSKGSKVMVVGTVSAHAYTSSNGEPAASLDLRAREVKFLSSSNGAGQTDPDPGNIPF